MRSFSVDAPKLQTAALKYEVNPHYCREAAVLLAGDGDPRRIAIGQILGAVMSGAVTVGEPAFTGTGNGALTKGNPAYGPGVQAGTYVVRLVVAATDSGHFQVVRPDGTIDGYAVVGTLYDGQVRFTIADGGTDFGGAAQFTLAVEIEAEDGAVKEWDPDATDGSQVPWGIAIAEATAPDGENGTVLAVRRGPAGFLDSGLVWPEGATDEEKAAALAWLEDEMGIVVRGIW